MQTIVDLGSVPEWLAAIGTIAATVTAIWLALRNESERLTVGFSLDDRRFEIYVVNASDRRILIQEIELELGRWKPDPEHGLEIIFTQQARVPVHIDARQDKTFTVTITYEPSYLPDRINKARLKRLPFDRALFVVVTTGERTRQRFRVPSNILKEMLANAPAVQD